MAKTSKRSDPAPEGIARKARRWLVRGVGILVVLALALIGLFSGLNPPGTPYIWQEQRRLGAVEREWVALDAVAPVMARAVVAAEDANFCRHWGIDITAVRRALAQGRRGGASTISQQMVKNVYLWPARSWVRKGIEALMTPVVEAVWSKQRILEVYLNVAEFDEGVFGIAAASQHYYGISPDRLSAPEAAMLATLLPAPKMRDPHKPTAGMLRRAERIQDGATTILRDGRADCFQT